MPNPIYGSFMLPQAAPEYVAVHQLTKADRSQADSVVLATIDGTPKHGDIAVITTTAGDKTISKVAYMYDAIDASGWVALVGEVDASKVMIYDNINMAGNYTAVGNLTKTLNGTATFQTAGKSVMDALTEIFTKTLQPGTPTQPAVSGFSLTGAKAVEAGTKITTAQFGTAVLSAGSYQYGPATGITATAYSVDRVCTPSSASATGIATAASGTDDNAGAGFVIGDMGEGGNVVSSLAYKVNVTHGDGAVANDNVGNPSNPEVKITGGTKTQTTAAYTPFRCYFYGAQVTPISIDSNGIRSLAGKSQSAGGNGTTFQISVPDGATQVVIAYPATLRDLTSVKDQNAFGTDIIASFVKTGADQTMVEGAENYTTIAYKVFVYTPATALGANTYDVTI